jgi:hypothetical protein
MSADEQRLIYYRTELQRLGIVTGKLTPAEIMEAGELISGCKAGGRFAKRRREAASAAWGAFFQRVVVPRKAYRF